MNAFAEDLERMYLHTRSVNLGHPNPGVRAALYVGSFLKEATGRYCDTDFARLLNAAFCAIRRSAPDWIWRLALERHRDQKRRRSWLRRRLDSLSPKN
jgi:hypothetical protein